MEYVAGTAKVTAKLKAFGDKMLGKVAEAVEKTAVDVANDAKADHVQGMAHAIERYENQTNVLTSSITPELTIVTDTMVEAEVFSNVEYAYWVEALYPLLHPALTKNEDNFRRRVAEAMK